MNTKKRCGRCDIRVTSKNWARHLRSQRYLRNDPDQTLTPRSRRPPRIFTNPRKAHKVFNFKSTLFDTTSRIRTVVRAKRSAYRYRLQTLEIENSKNFLGVEQFLNSIQRPVIGNIRRELARHNNLKVNLILVAEFKRNENEYQQINFRTRNVIITPTTNFNEFYATTIRTITNRMEEFEIRGSNWVLNRILDLELALNRYNPLRGRSYIPLL